ncbi:MAG TPA: ribonuclease P protein component [Chitinophagaceae bacterium]
MAKQFTLGKDERLKSRKAIEQLFKEGKRFTVSPFRVYYLLIAGTQTQRLQFGIGVSAKNFKKAVDRNKVKRLTREAYRLQKNLLQDQLKKKNRGLHLFLIYTINELPDYKLVNDKVDLILKKLSRLIDENNTSNS